MYAVMLAIFLSIVSWTDFGMILGAICIGSGLICLQNEWFRNLLIALYVVGIFWFVIASY